MALDSQAWRDAEFAHTEVPRFIREVATFRGWSPDQLTKALADEQTAYEAADAASYFGVDIATYWGTLARLVTDGPYRNWNGGVEYAKTILGAFETYDAEEAQRYRTSIIGSVTGGVEASAGAVADAGKKAAETVSNPAWLWGAAALVVVILIAQGRR